MAKLRPVLLLLVYLLLALVAAPGLFLLLRNPIVTLITCELEIARKSYEVIPKLYKLHTIALYLLVLAGIGTCLRYLWLWLGPYIKKPFPPYAQNKNIYLHTVAGFITVAAVMLVLFGFEGYYTRAGYFPGSFYRTCNFSDEKITVLEGIVADERGLTSFFPYTDFLGDSVVINQQGFVADFNYDKRTIDSVRAKGKKIIFVIGDSFVQGSNSASGLQRNTFMAVLRRNNPDALICNLGMCGTDAANYQLIAEKYIPELKPDKVWLIPCAWNDLVNFDRKPRPWVPQLVNTTNGFMYLYIPPFVSGKLDMVFTPDSAYEYYRHKYSLFKKTDLASVVCRQSNITTRLFNKQYIESFVDHDADSLATYRHFKAVKDTALNNGATFEIALIPTPAMIGWDKDTYRKHTAWAFGEMFDQLHLCPAGYFAGSDFISPDDLHFNDAGNSKYAQFLQPLMMGKLP